RRGTAGAHRPPKLIGAQCEYCDGPVIFSSSKRQATTPIICPSCADVLVNVSVDSATIDGAAAASEILEIAVRLQRLADPEEKLTEHERAACCRASASKLFDLSMQLVPPNE